MLEKPRWLAMRNEMTNGGRRQTPAPVATLPTSPRLRGAGRCGACLNCSILGIKNGGRRQTPAPVATLRCGACLNCSILAIKNGGAPWLFTELHTIYQAVRGISIPWAKAA